MQRTLRSQMFLSPDFDDMNGVRFTSVRFRNFKAFQDFSLRLDRVNVLVGPNNCGKSTLLGAFRVLEAGLRRAKVRKPDMLKLPIGHRYGYLLSEENLPISIENVHTDYMDVDSSVNFRLSNGNNLVLYFPVDGRVVLYSETETSTPRSPAAFRKAFPVNIAVVPTLGPLEHDEVFVQKETVQRELYTHRASRHFRCYWHYFPEGFQDFAELVKMTWPGMEVEAPEKPSRFAEKPTIAMFCLENRISRELYWAGFGFQVWCQLLTHISRSKRRTILVVDEPEIYLHPDIQKQLLKVMREAGPDLLLATHSTEIIADAEASEIVLVDKKRKSGKRLSDISEVQAALEYIGSIHNIELTNLARHRRVLFVENHNDYRILKRFAGKLGLERVGTGQGFSVILSGGAGSWEKLLHTAAGIEEMLGTSLRLAVVFDRDNFPSELIGEIKEKLSAHFDLVHFHQRKEIENYLLVPDVLARAFKRQLREHHRDGEADDSSIESVLDEVSEKVITDAIAQYAAIMSDFNRSKGVDMETSNTVVARDIENKWSLLETRLPLVPGKQVLKHLRARVEDEWKVNLTDARIIDAFKPNEIPNDLKEFLIGLEKFASEE